MHAFRHLRTHLCIYALAYARTRAACVRGDTKVSIVAESDKPADAVDWDAVLLTGVQTPVKPDGDAP